jgi:hypothetical protein
MRITKVNLMPDNSSNIIEMSFRDARRQNPYHAKAIIGLDADELVSKFYGGINSNLFDILLKKREIVVLVELNPHSSPGQTYSSLRDAFFRLIGATRTGKVKFEFADEDGVKATISGFVTKMEAPLFNQVPEIQLTVDCKPDPILRTPDPITITTGLDPSRKIGSDKQ